MRQESDGNTNCNRCAQYSHQQISKGTGVLGNKRTSGDHQDYSIIKISQNTKESLGEIRFVLTQTLLKTIC